MSDSSKAVFLSYASQDADAAKKICDALRAAGIEVWFDQSELVGGDAWDQKIRKQIRDCALLIPIISKTTQARREAYFRLEWKLADERTHLMAKGTPFLLPVTIDETSDREALVPDAFLAVQWTKTPGGEVPPAFVGRVKKLLEGENPTVGAALRRDGSAESGHKAPPAVKSPWRPVLVAAMVIVAAAGAWFALRPAPAVPVANSKSPVSGPPPRPAAVDFPRDPDLKRVYGMLYNVVDGIAEDFALMDDIVNPLLKARPNDPEVVTVAAELAQQYISRGYDVSSDRRAQAQRLTERAFQLAPDNPEALAALGLYLDSTGNQLGRAEELLRRAIKLKPTEPRFQCYLYHLLIKAKKPAAEIDAFGAQLAARFPDYPMASYLIADHQAATSNFAAAEEWIGKTLAIAPLPYAVLLKARLMLEVHGDVAGMERALEQMPERQRTSAALLNAYAVLATVTGQTGSARRVLEATADTWLVDGTYVFPRALLVGELEQIDGHADVARRQFEAAAKEIKARLDAAPTDLWPIRAELWAQIGLGHQEEARAVLRTNLEKRPRPYRWTMGFTWWTGALRGCLLLGERAQALGLLKEACAEAPGRLLLRNLFRVDPKMAPFRDDPEVVALLAEPAPADSSGKLVPPDKKSVAVLPFVNMGADKNDEYLGDGMTEELLNALAKVKGLRVPGRSSSFAFKGRNDDDIFRQVSAKLHVSTVLEGSVRKVGDKLRITAQLINCADGNHLWSEEYDRSMADLLAVQAEVAQQVAQKLQVALGVDETRALAKAATRNPEAHRLYLLGRFHFAKLTEAGYAEAARYYHEALRLDPDYALPYCGLADNYGFFGGVSMPGREAWPKQKELAEKALALDPNLAEAHFSLGLAFADTFDWPAAEREMRRALELNPNYALAHDQYAWVLLTQGRIDEALAEQARALEIDPLSPLFNLDYAMWLTYARRWDEAYAQIRHTQELDPNSTPGTLGRILYFKGDLAGALAQSLKRSYQEPKGFTSLAFIYARMGEKAKVEQILRELDEIAKRRYVSPSVRAYVYLALGEREKALDALEQAYVQQDLECSMLKVEPLFDPLRDEPRFQALMRQVGLEP